MFKEKLAKLENFGRKLETRKNDIAYFRKRSINSSTENYKISELNR